MLYKTHFIFSLFLGLIFLNFFQQNNPLLFLIILAFSGFLPDLDHPKSKLGRKLKIISWPINFILGHRGFFHSVFPPLIIYLMFYFLNLDHIGLPIFLGFITHLIGDSLSKEGIAFFYPISKVKVSGFFKTGGIIEKIIYYILILVILVYLFKRLVL